MPTFVVGLTGGIATGKSTVAALFAELGVPIIDADVIARDLTEVNSPAHTAIIERYGDRVVFKGELNRAALRSIIFSHEEERHWLEKLLHPLITIAIKEQMMQVNAPYCIAAIPLLVETGPYDFIQRILVVDAPRLVQMERLMMRDHASKTEALAILETQADRETRLAQADDIIENDGILADLRERVKKLHEQYLQLSQ